MASLYRALGYALCAAEPGEKRPGYPEWTLHLLTPDDFGPGQGIGIMCGPVSGRPCHQLVCVDLDSPEALALADRHLPPTAMVEGRPSKPRAHRYFMVPLASVPPEHFSTAEMASEASVAEYGHPGSKTLHFAKTLDVLGTGAQAAAPPSMHESGETRAWEGGLPGEPAVVGYPELLGAVDRLLAACDHAPAKKSAGVVRPARNPGPRAALLVAPAAGSARLDPQLRGRVRAYLAKVPPAVSGEGGHNRTFAAACILVQGFALDADSTLEFLALDYNPRCRPPWSTAELRHKVEGAALATNHTKPRGHLLGRPGPRAGTNQRFKGITTPWTNR